MATKTTSYNLPKDIFSGVLYKCGAKFKSWTKRWMILRDDSCLYYYKDVTKKPLGIISLRDPNCTIRVGARGDCTWPKNTHLPNTLVLVTSPRTYYMFAESTIEAEQWRGMLEMMHDKLREEVIRDNNYRATNAADFITSKTNPNDVTFDEDDIMAKSCPASAGVLGFSGSDAEVSPAHHTQDYLSVYSSPLSDDDVETAEEGGNMQSVPQPNGHSSTTGGGAEQPNETLLSIYDLAAAVREEERPDSYYEFVNSAEETKAEMEAAPMALSLQYEAIDISTLSDDSVTVTTTPVTSSVRSQPLPPIPLAAAGKSLPVMAGSPVVAASQGPVIYEDIPGVALYEDLDRVVRVGPEPALDSESDDERPLSPGPPLPPRDGLEPAMPLPSHGGEDPSPMLPPHNNSHTPPLPTRDSNKSPPLRQTVPPSRGQSSRPSSKSEVAPSDVAGEIYDSVLDDEPQAVYDEVAITLADSSGPKRETATKPQPTPRTPPLALRATPLALPGEPLALSPPSTGLTPPTSKPVPRARSPRSSPVTPHKVFLLSHPHNEDADSPLTPPSTTPPRHTPPSPQRHTPQRHTPPSPLRHTPLSPPPTPTKTPPPLPPKDDGAKSAAGKTIPPLPPKEVSTAPPSTKPAPIGLRDKISAHSHPKAARGDRPTVPSKEGALLALGRQTEAPSPGGAAAPLSLGEGEGRVVKENGVEAESEEAVYDCVTEEEKGMLMFERQGLRTRELIVQDERHRAQTQQLLKDVRVAKYRRQISVEDTSAISETLREVEQERLLVSEERFRWERERLKFEEERRQFEEERLQLQRELAAARSQLQMRPHSN